MGCTYHRLMRLRMLATVAVCVIVAALGQAPASGLTNAAGYTFGEARGSCVGLVALDCEVHFGSWLFCREAASNVLVQNCGAYGSVQYSAVGPHHTCVGTGVGSIVIYSPSRGSWTTVIIEMVMTAGVAEIWGTNAIVGRILLFEGQVTLAGGCAGTVGVFNGTWQIVDS